MPDAETELPALIFSGPYAEALFLKSLLGSAGIETSLEPSVRSRLSTGPRLFVRRRNVEAAREFVEDFLNGKRTNY